MLYRSAVLGMLFATMSLTAVQMHHDLDLDHDGTATATATARTHHRTSAHVLGHAGTAPRLGELTGTDVITVSPMTNPAMVTRFIKLGLDEHVHSIDGLVVESATAADVAQRVRVAASRLSPQHPAMSLVVDRGDLERRIVVEQSYSTVLY